MNIAEYLKSVGYDGEDGAWLSNDHRYLFWDKQRNLWTVRNQEPDSLKRKPLYEGRALRDAIDCLKSTR